MNEYLKQAVEFCKSHDTKIKIEYLKTDKHFQDDKEKRDIYKITITRIRNGKSIEYNFNFGDSIDNTEKNQIKMKDYASGKMKPTGGRKQIISPNEYDILSCLQKYEVGYFDEFCADYGYKFNTEREMVKVKTIYFAVSDEAKNVMKLFSDCMDELQEIC